MLQLLIQFKEFFVLMGLGAIALYHLFKEQKKAIENEAENKQTKEELKSIENITEIHNENNNFSDAAKSDKLFELLEERKARVEGDK